MKQAKRFILSFLSLMLCTIMYAQQEITGTVTDAMGPVIGATVMEKGTSNGTVTDFDGNFTIKVEAGKTLGKVQLAKNVKGNFFRTAAR